MLGTFIEGEKQLYISHGPSTLVKGITFQNEAIVWLLGDFPTSFSDVQTCRNAPISWSPSMIELKRRMKKSVKDQTNRDLHDFILLRSGYYDNVGMGCVRHVVWVRGARHGGSTARPHQPIRGQHEPAVDQSEASTGSGAHRWRQGGVPYSPSKDTPEIVHQDI